MTKTFHASITTLHTFSITEEAVREAYEIPEDEEVSEYYWNAYATVLLEDFKLENSCGYSIIPNDIEIFEVKN